jgi:hypothetical protein
MLESYPAMYCDKLGEEIIVIHNDGKNLRMVVRGVEFVGHEFDLFDPPADCDPVKLESFSFWLGALCSCEIECDIPVTVFDNHQDVQGILKVRVQLGESQPSNGKVIQGKDHVTAEEDRVPDILQLTLVYDGKSFKSGGKDKYATFDEQLLEIKPLLPEGVYLKTCWSCAFSDYHPAGSGAFGNLACFRNHKDEYCQVSSKKEFFELWDKRAESVQEIYLCPEFATLPPGSRWRYKG